MPMDVAEAVLTRRSIRAFQDKPVPLDVIRRVMDIARWAPSGCNFQPWEATIVTGQPLKDLQAKMAVTPPQDPREYNWDDPEVIPECKARLHGVGKAMYGAMGIGRDDAEARNQFMASNLASFGAPAVLLCYFDRRMGPHSSQHGHMLGDLLLTGGRGDPQ